jgi:chromosome segregation ATPase
LGDAPAWPDPAPPPALGDARAWPSDVAPPPAAADPARLGDVPDAAVDTGRTGPLAELLFKESVSALHAELEERSAEVARLQGALADARSELEARVSRQSSLESAHGDLRGELQELMGAVGAQRDDYERRLSEAEERGAAELEAERTRSAAQLADLGAARDAAAADAADLRHRLATAASGRQHHAAELSALRDQLASAQVSREAAAGEVAGLRVELERLGSELAVTREHQSAHGADLGEAQRLLAEARSLSEQLRSQSSH